MGVEIRQIDGGKYIILINGRSLSYSLPSLESALKEVKEIFATNEIYHD